MPLDKDAEVEVTDDEEGQTCKDAFENHHCPSLVEPDNGDVECSEPDDAPVENLDHTVPSQEGEAQDHIEVVAKKPRLDH